MLWGVLLLGGLTATGWSAALRNVAEAIAGRIAPGSGTPPGTILVFVVLLSLLNEIVGLPLSFYGGLSAGAPVRAVQGNAWRLAGRSGQVVRHRRDPRDCRRGAGVRVDPPVAGAVVVDRRLHLHAHHRRADQPRAGRPPPDLLFGEAARSRCAARAAARAGRARRRARARRLRVGARRENQESQRGARRARRGPAGSSSPTRCSPSSPTTRSRSCSRTKSPTMSTGDIWKGIAFESVLIVAGFYPRVGGAARDGRPAAFAAWQTSPGCRCCCSRPGLSRW